MQKVRSGDRIAGERVAEEVVGGVGGGGCMVIMGCQNKFALVHFLTAGVAGQRVDQG